MLSFLNRCVPGIQIPQHYIDRLAAAADPLQEGIKIAAEQVQAARQLCQGVHLMAIRREDLIPQILDLAGVAPIVQTVQSNGIKAYAVEPIETHRR
jgi:methylenetetrahydrofolate reductase (NADPH)